MEETDLTWHDSTVSREKRQQLMGHRGCVAWFTGLSGSGKSTVANLVDASLHAAGVHSFLLDGDNVRHGLNKDLGFTDADRVENIRRISETARLFVDAGVAGIIVSNHGGRVLDTVPAPVTQLAAVVQAVGQDVPVYLDGGIRRGSDVFKALALGAEAVLVGDRRRFVSVLLVPDFPTLTQRLAVDGLAPGTPAELVVREDIQRIFQPIVDQANSALASYEQVKRFALLPAEFAVATGELTPTLKVKRRVVEERWKDAIEEIDAQSPPESPGA